MVGALAVLIIACGDDGEGGRDGGVRRSDAGDAGRDAGRKPDGGGADSAVGEDETYWRCNLNDYGCICIAQQARPRDNVSCDTSGCCILVKRPDDQTCACLSSDGAELRQQTCSAWLDEQMQGCSDAECTLVESCPPGTPPVQEDAGRDAAVQQDAGVPQDAASDAAADGGGLPPIPNQGEFQSCVYREGCLEFRDHRPSCYESNQINCEGGFSGRYAVGKCPTGAYKQTFVDPTSCGETATYLY